MALSDLFTNNAAQGAANTAQGILQMGLGTATNQIGTGVQKASNYLDTASSILGGSRGTAAANYAPYVPGANAAWDDYSRLISGDPNTVSQTLMSQPGFQASMDAANQAINRTFAAGGMGNSGNALVAASDRARQLEEGNINNYASRILQLAQYGPQIAGAETAAEMGIDQLLAGVQQTQAQNQMTAGAETAGLTSAAFNTDAQNQANAQLAQQQAAANVWNAIMGVGDLAVKGFTAGGGGATGTGGTTPFGNLSSTIGGWFSPSTPTS